MNGDHQVNTANVALERLAYSVSEACRVRHLAEPDFTN
jgi:hypothetical protein